MAGEDEPVLAAAVLEPIYESAGEWDRVIAVYEVMAANSRRPGAHASSCCRASPRSRSGGCRTRTPPSTSTGARCASIRPTRTCWRTSIAWPARPVTGPKLADLLRQPSWRRSRSRAGRSICCCASARVYEEETGQLEEAIATYRRGGRRRARQQGGAGRAGSASTAAPSSGTSWPTSCGARSASPPTDEERVALTFRLAQIYELALGRHAQGRRGLPRDPDRRPDARRDARRARADVHGRHDAARDRRRARAALPRGRGVGEAAPDLRGAARAADRRRASGRRCCAGWRRSPSTSWSIRSRPSAGGPRRSRKIRRRSRRSTSCCAWRARRTSGTPTSPPCSRRRRPSGRRRCGATCCCGWPPASRTISAISSAPRRRCVAGARRAREGCRRRWPRSIASTRARGCTRTWPGSCASASPSPTTPPSWSRCNLRLGRVYAEALDERRPRDRQLPRGAGARVALARGAGRARAALLPQRALARSSTASTRRWSTSPGDEMRHGRLLRAHGEARRRRARRSRTRPSSCGAASSTSAARTPSRSRAWPICTRWPSEWKELTEVLEQAGRGDRRSRGADPDLQAPRAASGARSCRASATRSRAGRRSWRSIRRTSTPCAPSPPTTGARAPGRSCRRRCAA